MKCYVHPEVDAIGTCTKCGRSVCSGCAMEIDGKVVCKNCVEKSSKQTYVKRKEPILSLILSFFIPGLGQIYNGQATKGIVLIIAAVISVVLATVCIGGLTYLLVWLYAMFDAYVTAERINKGEVKI